MADTHLTKRATQAPLTDLDASVIKQPLGRSCNRTPAADAEIWRMRMRRRRLGNGGRSTQDVAVTISSERAFALACTGPATDAFRPMAVIQKSMSWTRSFAGIMIDNNRWGSIMDVGDWLRSLGLGQYESLFRRE